MPHVIRLLPLSQVAIHLAAAPREFLSPAIQIQHNVFGLEQFLRVCEGMVHARSILVHSTTFAHVDKAVVEERLYPTLHGVLVIIRIIIMIIISKS